MTGRIVTVWDADVNGWVGDLSHIAANLRPWAVDIRQLYNHAVQCTGG